MAVRFRIVARTKAYLDANSSASNSTQPEAIPYTFFDQQNFATLWTGVSFFSNVQADPTLGNIQQQNTLSADQYFQLEAITLDWIISATALSTSGVGPAIVDDLLQILNGARGKFVMQLAMKTYIDTPFHCFHSSGGINVQYQVGQPAANAIGNYAQNWYPDGGYNIGGSIILPPRQTFTFVAVGVAAALSTTRAGRVTMWGTLYRKVV